MFLYGSDSWWAQTRSVQGPVCTVSLKSKVLDYMRVMLRQTRFVIVPEPHHTRADDNKLDMTNSLTRLILYHDVNASHTKD